MNDEQDVIGKSRNMVLFIAISLDGYIAAEDDSLEWLFEVDGEGDNGYSDFYETVDTIILGKRTYDWIMNHQEGEFPYKDKECFVFTRSSFDETEDVKFVHEDIVEFTDNLKKKKGKNIWLVGGSDLLQSFLKENMIDEFIITVAPTLIGKGIPLFKEGFEQLELTLRNTRRFNQFVELHYSRKEKP
ncbi:dihydrofolate reductase family protein [Oceanobacillus massiliensis]|uniref:dihydrofolate reductase family protein n=1 Tax=Oceanobacillus massiliensis TaxID=1465765 RepID=UPI00301B13B6